VSVEEAPDFAEAFCAWRVWRVVPGDEGFVLRSVVQATYWPRQEALVAECLRPRMWLRRRRPHAVADIRCVCGVYAARFRDLGPYLIDDALFGSRRVVGEVALWGAVIECERGFRASHAYPRRIFVPTDADGRRGHVDEIAASLCEYGVPVELLPVRHADAAPVLAQFGRNA
jgi:hypothetical protein